MRLPQARGPLSGAVLAVLAGRAPLDERQLLGVVDDHCPSTDVLTDDDLHLTLWVLYELHYRGFDDTAADWEWEPGVLRVRRRLEDRLLAELRFATAERVHEALERRADPAARLFALTESVPGPPLAAYLQREASAGQFREYLQHKSIYHLKESDPQSFALPRLTGPAKVALAEIQYDEYGGGRPERLHQALFAAGLTAAGLSDEYGAYVDLVPGATLAVTNAMNLLALRRSLTPAAMGHLGAFEATSSVPCRRIVGGARRLGLPDAVAGYFDEHVEADAVHEQLAFRDICGALVAEDTAVEAEVLFGAAAYLVTEALAGQALLDAWAQGRSSLRTPVAPPAPDAGAPPAAPTLSLVPVAAALHPSAVAS